MNAGSDCLWLNEEFKRQASEKNGVSSGPIQLYTPTGFIFMHIAMPNGDEYQLDVCLKHGCIKPTKTK